MYLRIKGSCNDNSNSLVGLLHSRRASALYSMFELDNAIENQANARNLASLVQEMYFPIKVCMPHQILRYSLQGKGWESVLSEFPNSVFIFDEIHAYNPKLTGLMMATVRYLIGHRARCMFITATLPTFLPKLVEREYQVPSS
jgi:CRISPR-associated endonuclease/helicase Cas3